jgi:four helix bundle protein
VPMQDFRRLDVWARAHRFATTIRRLARSFVGVDSDFKDQLADAAESIPSNIVEGCGAATNKEFARYLDMSIKSAFEVDYRLELARDYELITEATWQEHTAEVVEIRKMTYGLRRTVLARDPLPPKRKRRMPKRKPGEEEDAWEEEGP